MKMNRHIIVCLLTILVGLAPIGCEGGAAAEADQSTVGSLAELALASQEELTDGSEDEFVIASPPLEMDLHEGLTYRQSLQMVSDMALPFGIPNADHKDSTVVMACEVLAVDGAGGATVEVTIESLDVSMISLSVKASYDSTAPAPTGKLDSKKQRFREVFGGLAGRKYKALVDAQGRVVELRDVDSKIQRAAQGAAEGSLGEDQLALLLSHDNLRDVVVPPLFNNLPRAEAEVDDSWSDEQVILVPRSAARVLDRKYRLVRYEREEDASYTAMLEYDGKLSEADAPVRSGKGGGLEIVEAGNKGEIRYSATFKRPMEMTDSTRAEIRTAQGGRKTQPRKGGRQNKIYYYVKRTITMLD